MLVIPEQKVLVMQLCTARVTEILSVIPHAKAFLAQGKQLVAVPHGLEEVQILRNIGYAKAPVPILEYYKWPGYVTPMEHQRVTAAFLVANNRALCLNAPGTGKTLSSLWAADYLLSEALVKRVLIVAPLSTLKPVWAREIAHHLCHRRFEVVVGDRKRKKMRATNPDVEFVIVNHDGFTAAPEWYADCDLVIYDEATAVKTPSSNRYKRFAKFISERAPRLWLLTGTPITQTPMDAWTLAKLVRSSAVPHSFTQFKNQVMRQVTPFKWVPRPEALDICQQVLQPSIRYSLEECKGLPDTLFIDRECELTPDQQKAFQELREEATLVAAGGVISAANAAVLYQKLLQLCCGVVYAEDGAQVEFDDTSRLDLLKDTLEEISDKCIIFVPLRSVQDRLESKLRAIGYTVDSVHGGVSKTARDNIFQAFQDKQDPQILIAHPKVAAYGLTLTRAKHIIWYAPIHSLEMYEQANARIKRISTEGKTTIWHITASAFEREMFKRLVAKRQVLSDFLTMIAGVNE